MYNCTFHLLTKSVLTRFLFRIDKFQSVSLTNLKTIQLNFWLIDMETWVLYVIWTLREDLKKNTLLFSDIDQKGG